MTENNREQHGEYKNRRKAKPESKREPNRARMGKSSKRHQERES
jgi:hypothetical protein